MDHDFAGAFSWNSLLCRFVTTDVDPADKQHSEIAGLFAATFKDGLTMVPFQGILNKSALSESARSILFHESVHYWQLCSSPFLQSYYVLALQQLRIVAGTASGGFHTFCGNPFLDEDIELATKLFNKGLGLLDRGTNDFKLIDEQLAVLNPKTSILWFYLPVPGSDWQYPASGFALQYADGERGFIATIRHLVESAAFVAQRLHAGNDLPRLLFSDDEESDYYLGLWEVWARYHSTRFTSEHDAALAFLATVDLALLGDDQYLSGGLGSAEQDSYPSIRFAKLFAASGRIPSLTFGSSTSDAVVDYQNRLCVIAGFTPIPVVIRNGLRRLTLILLLALAGQVNELNSTSPEVLFSLLDDLSDDERCEAVLPTVWEQIARVLSVFGATAIPLGTNTLAMMVNALVFRREHPGVFGAPHLYASELENALPLPVVTMRGEHYFMNPAELRHPFSDLALHTDALLLTAAFPLIYRELKCGYLAMGIECWYMRHGLGCPYGSGLLSTANIVRRSKLGVDDWCHKTWLDLRTGLAAKETMQKWKSRLNKRPTET